MMSRRPTTLPPEGLLLVDKPPGLTSHDVVAVARRAIGQRRIGHAGTLDPFATGLLVLLVGRATRLLPYLAGEPKVYRALVHFGTETDTDDRTGTPTRSAALPTVAAIDAALRQLTGPLWQEPPAYSAKQHHGERAHAAARRGQPLALPPARVTVHAWQVQARSTDVLDATVVCSGGTYIRALARDLGRLAGSAAHLAELRRLCSGPFAVEDATSLQAVRTGHYALMPPLGAVPHLPVQPLTADDLAQLRAGRPLPALVDGAWAALVAPEGSLAGIGQRAGGAWHPRVVLARE